MPFTKFNRHSYNSFFLLSEDNCRLTLYPLIFVVFTTAARGTYCHLVYWRVWDRRSYNYSISTKSNNLFSHNLVIFYTAQLHPICSLAHLESSKDISLLMFYTGRLDGLSIRSFTEFRLFCLPQPFSLVKPQLVHWFGCLHLEYINFTIFFNLFCQTKQLWLLWNVGFSWNSFFIIM